MPLYEYEALQDSSSQIRLIELHLDTEDSSLLACSLSIWRIEHAPAYVAISYTWGDPSSTCTISVNGMPTEVRSTCCDALNQVGMHRKSRYYWLDALCIDQDNLQEKAQQVAIMADIFEGADRVIAYVGPAADHSDGLMQNLRWLGERRCSLYETYGWAGQNGIACWTLTLSADLAMVDDIWYEGLIAALMKFSNRPWFSRLWVAQEIFVAKEIDLCCGDKIADMMELQYLLASRPFSLILMMHKHNVRTMSELESLQKMMNSCFGIDLDQSLLRKVWGDDVAFKGREWDRHVFHRGLYHLMSVIQLARRADRTPQRVGVIDSNTSAFFPYFGARYVSQFADEDPDATSGIDTVQSLINDMHCQDPRDKIFGTLRFVRGIKLDALRPDYTITPFDLALKVLRVYVSEQPKSSKCFRLAEDLVRNLKLDLRTPEVDRALTLRKFRMFAPPGGDGCKEKEDVLREQHCHSSRLIATKSGVLSALLQLERRFDQYKKPDSSTEFDWNAHMHYYKPLYVFGEFCGLVSSAAQPGDYLVQLHGELDPRATLVVRRSSAGQSSPQIVGVAHLYPGVRTCVDPYDFYCRCFRKFDLRFSAEDLLVLAARHVAVATRSATIQQDLKLLNVAICKSPYSSWVERETALSDDMNDRKAEARHEKNLFEKLKLPHWRNVEDSFARHLSMQAMSELVCGRRTIPGREKELAFAFAPVRRFLGGFQDDSDDEELKELAKHEDLWDWGNILKPGSSFMRGMEKNIQGYLKDFPAPEGGKDMSAWNAFFGH